MPAARRGPTWRVKRQKSSQCWSAWPVWNTFDLKQGAPKESLTITRLILESIWPFATTKICVTDSDETSVYVLRKGKPRPAKSRPMNARRSRRTRFCLCEFEELCTSIASQQNLRLDLAKDGKVSKITDLKLSRPLQGPDGMRAIDGKRLIMAEGNGRAALAVPNGDGVEVTTTKKVEWKSVTQAVTVTKGMGWKEAQSA